MLVRATKDIMDYTRDEVLAMAGTEFEVFAVEGDGQVWVGECGDLLLTDDEYEIVDEEGRCW